LTRCDYAPDSVKIRQNQNVKAKNALYDHLWRACKSGLWHFDACQNVVEAASKWNSGENMLLVGAIIAAVIVSIIFIVTIIYIIGDDDLWN